MADKTYNAGDTPAAGRWTVGRIPPRLAVSAVLAILAVIFIVQNREATRISFLTATVLMPLWAALTALTALGLVLGYLLARRR